MRCYRALNIWSGLASILIVIQKQQTKKKSYVAVLIDDILLITHLYLVKNHMNNSFILFY